MYVHKKGSSFQQTMSIPAAYADGYFVGWTVVSKVKKLDGTDVATLTTAWTVPATTRELTLTALDTSGWPLELVELDVKFTRTADNFKLATSTVQFTVVPGIS